MTSSSDPAETRSRSERLLAATHRHPVVAVFVVALVLRGTVAMAVSVAGAELNPDEWAFWGLATDRLGGDTAHWGGFEHDVYRQSRAFVWMLMGLQWLIGPVEVAGRLLVALLGAGTAVLAYVVAQRLWSSRAGLAAGLVVAVWPSYVFFSSLIMKDALVWLLLIGLAVTALRLRDAEVRRLPAVFAAAVAVLALVGLVRATSMMAAGAAFLVAAWASRTGWAWRGGIAAGALIVVMVVPASLGYGPGGVELIERAPELVEIRAERARGAHTTFVEPVEDPTYGDLVRRVPRGVTVMLFEPVPWRDVGSTLGELAKAEAALWWAAMIAAGTAVWRRREALPALVFPLALFACLVIVGAVGSDNIGTAFRHRGEFLWIGVVLASGLVSGSPRSSGRRRDGARPDAAR